MLFLLGWKKRMLILHMSWNWCYIFSRLYIKCDFLVHSRNLTGFVSERGRLWMQFQVSFFHPALLRLCSTFAILGLVSAILISFIILCLLKYCSLFLSIKKQCTMYNYFVVPCIFHPQFEKVDLMPVSSFWFYYIQAQYSG